MIADIAKRIAKVASDNSPALLTAVGAAGVLTTAVLTGKASFKAAQIIIDEQEENFKETGIYEPLPFKDAAALVWQEYIPATAVATGTIVAVVMANRIGTRRAAAFAAAYSLSEKAFVEYKDKVVEKMGATKEQRVRDEIMQERVTKNPSKEVFILEGQEQLCFDAYSGRYFKSTMEAIKKAQNDLNYRVINDNYASVTNFYNLLGLPKTDMSDEMGWNIDKLLELEFYSVISEDQKPAIAISFRAVPISGYNRLH